MNLPEPTRPPLPEPRRSSPVSIILALVLLLVAATLLTVLTLGYFGPVIPIATAIFLVILLHYFVWGRWLGRIIREEEQREKQE